MNDLETQIDSAIAIWRGQKRPQRHGLAIGPSVPSYRPSSRNETGQAQRITRQIDSPGSLVPSQRPRPSVPGNSSRIYEAATALGCSPVLWGLATVVFGLMLFRGMYYAGLTSGPVVVHLVWPV